MCEIEDRFRLSKNENLVGVQPIRHWTHRNIKCLKWALTYWRGAGIDNPAVPLLFVPIGLPRKFLQSIGELLMNLFTSENVSAILFFDNNQLPNLLCLPG